MLSHEKLDSYKIKALDLYQTNHRIKYSFTAFEGVYLELTYHMVSHVLAESDLSFLDHVVMTLLRESISNAVKANLKRAYFENNNADINDATTYNELIKNFKSECVSRIEDHIETLNSKNLNVHLVITKNKDSLLFSIENDVAINEDELNRIQSRIEASQTLTNMAEAFDKFEDEQEGAGLGLIISMMLLKKSGINPSNFSISSENGRTYAQLSVPLVLKNPTAIDDIYEKIKMELENIPTFPQSIQQVIELCDNPDSDSGKIANIIEKDPALATSIVRLANSNSFSLGKKITQIKQAMTVIGIKNIRNLALALSSRKILNKEYKVVESVWEHAEKCASYSRLIAKELNLNKSVDNVYLGGLLHDLGKIILLSISAGNKDIGNEEVENKAKASSSIEEIELGISHTIVGAELAQHWNFPPNIVSIIRHHHSVFSSKIENIQEVSIVHIADAFIQKEKRKGGFIYVDQTAMGRLEIKDQDDLDLLHNKIKNLYELNNKN